MKNILYRESIVEIKHLFHIMKITTLALFIFVGTAFATESYSQAMKVTVVSDGISTGKVINEIEKQTDYLFVFNVNEVNLKRKVQVNARDKSVAEVLNKVFDGTGIYYAMEGKNIMLMKKSKENISSAEQVNQVKGIVKDETGESVIGANVTVKGQSIGTITDIDGRFVIDAPVNSVLQISYIGYIGQEVNVGKKRELVITLKEDTKTLDEVVVIGYGAVKKRDLTGAVASVKKDDIVLTPTGNVMEAISGRVAGLDITRESGSAGSKVNMTLRGSRSINGSNTPLFIIDGVEGSYEELNPNDIESIEVLKDASSTAIYGSAGANGVVIITTKKGNEGKTQISLDAYVGVNGFTEFPEVLTHDGFIRLRREAYRTIGEWNSEADDSKIFSNEEWDAIQNNQWVNWFDEATRNGIQQSYTVSMNGGTENTKSYLSVNYYEEQGILKNDEYTRYSLNGSIDKKINDWIKGGIKFQGTYSERDARNNQIWTRVLCLSPLGQPYDENGNIIKFPIAGNEELSPIADMAPEQYVNNMRRLSFAPNGYLEITPIKGLSIKSVLGAYLSFSRQGYYNGLYSATGYGNKKTSAQIDNTNRINYKWENIVNYTFTLQEKHNFTFTGVTGWTKNQYESSTGLGYNFDWDKYSFNNLGASTSNDRSLSSSFVGSQVMSYVLRLNYSFLGKYLLTVSNRWDGSSILAAGNRWDSFPAAAIAWRIGDEEFMKKIDWISNMKLRVGYGVTGNAGAKEYATQVFGFAGANMAFQDTPAPFYIPSQNIANPLLGWEKSYSTNIGLDLGFLRDRLNMTIDVYNTKTEDILFQRNLPASVGGFKGNNYSTWQNLCATSNKGVEIAISSRNIENKNFTWSTNLTFALNKEKITELTSDDPIKNGDYYLIKGQPINTYYNYKYQGIWQTDEADEAAKFGYAPGDIKLNNKTEDNSYDSKDYMNLGSPNPDWTAGMLNSFKFHDFDLSVFVQARYGQTIKADVLGWYCPSGIYTGPAICDYWTPENPGGHFPRPNRNKERFSNYFGSESLLYVDGSYLKVKNITLGYSLPKSFLDKMGISRARFYATISNPFIFTKCKYLRDYDPERGGADTYPLTKQMVFGVNVTF